jgi:hypothetical protein
MNKVDKNKWIELPHGATITPIFPPVIENTDSPYQTDTREISDELAFKVCELLGLDPDKINALTIEAGTFTHGIQLIVRSVKK